MEEISASRGSTMPPSFADVVRTHALERPDAVALRYQDRITSYDVVAIPSGKILRRALREPYWAGMTRRVN